MRLINGTEAQANGNIGKTTTNTIINLPVSISATNLLNSISTNGATKQLLDSNNNVISNISNITLTDPTNLNSYKVRLSLGTLNTDYTLVSAMRLIQSRFMSGLLATIPADSTIITDLGLWKGNIKSGWIKWIAE